MMQTTISITIVQLLSIVFFAGLTVLAAGIIVQVKHFTKKEKKKVQAEAIILNIIRTGLFIDNKPQVKLQMQVLPESGRNFIAELKKVISDAEEKKINAGTYIKVLYSPANLKDIELVTEL